MSQLGLGKADECGQGRRGSKIPKIWQTSFKYGTLVKLEIESSPFGEQTLFGGY